MHIVKLPLAGMIGLVAVTAVGIAAFTAPTAELANGLFTFVGGTLVFALLALLYRRGATRAFWTGFALFGWAYVTFCYAPVFGSSVRARLLTSTVIDRLYATLNPGLEATLRDIEAQSPNFAGYRWRVRFDQEKDPDADNVALTAIGQRGTTQNEIPFFPPSSCANLVWVRKSGHAIAALWVALFGGLMGRYLYGTRDRADPPPHEHHEPVA